MAGEVVISARGVTKRYAVYARPVDMLAELVTGRVRHRDFVALDDVSFDVRAGESVGVMGRNGAGKSTLLRIVAGTLEATRGRVDVSGRVAAILELGAGFHLQYTGRENVILGGMCMGMTEREARRKLDSIIEFAELRDFVDQPLRTYSTGMLSRLAFAVVVAVEPRVLIVDEALAVGDARFQLKCADKFREFRAEGRTILLVSHSTELVTTMCDRAILLERGKLVAEGPAAEVTRLYHRLLFAGEAGRSGAADSASARDAETAPTAPPTGAGAPDPASVPHDAPGAPPPGFDPGPPPPEGELDAGQRMGVGGLRIQRIQVLDVFGRDVRRLAPGATYTALFEAVNDEDRAELSAGFLVRDRSGQTIYGIDTRLDAERRFSARAGERFIVRMTFANRLGPGEYFLSFGVAEADGTKLDYCYDAVVLESARRPGVYYASRCDLEGAPEVVRVAEPAAVR